MSVNYDALIDISQVFHFEFWLRYYFVEEKDGELFIELSAEQKKQMRSRFPEYWELVERVVDIPLSPELSQRVVVEFIQLRMEGVKYPPNTVPTILDSRDFSTEMHLFDTWNNLHEDQLMQKIYYFDSWMQIYEDWKKTDKAQQLAQSLRLQMQEERGSMN
jgi:hypothetical protein